MAEMTDPQSLDLRLIVKRHGLILDERPVDQDTLSVGRDPDCDIVLEDPAASRRVAEFVFEEGGLWVVDSGSMGGISVGGEVVDRRRLRPGDEVEIGSFVIELRGSVEASEAAEPTIVVGAEMAPQDDRTVVLAEMQPKPILVMPDGSRLELEDGTLVLGRSAECDILLDSQAASKRHAELRINGPSVVLVDLGSTNGSRVNGEMVLERALASGDSMELADVTLQIELPIGAPSGMPHGAQTAEAPGGDATVVAGADLQQQIRDEAAAMARDKVKAEAPPKSRRLLLILMAAAAAIVVGLVAISVLAPTEQPVAPEPEPEPVVTATPAELIREGMELYEVGEILDAVDLWEQAIALDPTNTDIVDRYAQTLYRVGLIYEGDGQVDRAIEAWQRLTAQVQSPEHPYVVRAAAKLRKYE
jgi:pSer/pThr/pTyr-binding forkhead associated (FHA) protein